MKIITTKTVLNLFLTAACVAVMDSTSAQNLILNPGFETGMGGTADNWNLAQAAGGPVYGMRTNDNPNAGSFNFEAHLASTGAGPVVRFEQDAVPVTGGLSYNFSFYADALAGSAGDVTQWDIQWFNGGLVGETGFQNYTPGNNSYAFINNVVNAPAGATSADVIFYNAGAADQSLSATIDFDNVSLSAVPEPGTIALMGLGLFGVIMGARKRNL
ncbi:MAG TPA: PEP-CTERM sorting domain-containing protein [Verrucomicrobiae bacterium]